MPYKPYTYVHLHNFRFFAIVDYAFTPLQLLQLIVYLLADLAVFDGSFLSRFRQRVVYVISESCDTERILRLGSQDRSSYISAVSSYRGDSSYKTHAYMHIHTCYLFVTSASRWIAVENWP